MIVKTADLVLNAEFAPDAEEGIYEGHSVPAGARWGDLNSNHDKAKRVVEILADHNSVGLIKRRTGIPLRYMRNWGESLRLKDLIDDPDTRYVAGFFTGKDDMAGVVRDLYEADLGFSVVVSGLYENVFEICRNVGPGPHTVNMSMVTIGRTELYPDDRILEISMMCGHSLVSQRLVRQLINEVLKGKMTAEEAGLELGKQCVYNFLNPVRAARIVQEYATHQR